MKVHDISYKDFPLTHLLASYRVFGKWSPAVNKRENGTYSIRILVGRQESFRTGGVNESWGYFEVDPTGLIIESPRGMAKHFTKKVRIIDMEDFFELYKDKIINQ